MAVNLGNWLTAKVRHGKPLNIFWIPILYTTNVIYHVLLCSSVMLHIAQHSAFVSFLMVL